jgi:hypothetical protein
MGEKIPVKTRNFKKIVIVAQCYSPLAIQTDTLR